MMSTLTRMAALGLLVVLSLLPRLHAQSPLTYVYDELGRLIAVVDPAGETAIYVYDPAGNLLSISRRSSSILSIIHITPRQGPVGTTVTIHGTGFSATPSENTVRFSGFPAIVSASTTTRIVTSVPAGATPGSGPLAVTVGGQTVSTSFTVTAAGPGPTITGFTPDLANIGSPLTITGTNFASVPLDNRVAINLTHATVSSATSTSITTRVPDATSSGRVSVATSYGLATSDQYLYIRPPGRETAQVPVRDTARICDVRIPNDCVERQFTFTTTDIGRIGLVLFEGLQGRRMSILFPTRTLSYAFIDLYSPHGSLLIRARPVADPGIFFDPVDLFTTGTYAILIDPLNFSGQLGLILYHVEPDISGPIILNDPPRPVSISTPGQNARFTFAGTEGQQIRVRITSNGLGSLNVRVLLGSVSISNRTSSDPSFTVPAEPQTLSLPASGTYTVLINPIGPQTGTVNVAVTSP